MKKLNMKKIITLISLIGLVSAQSPLTVLQPSTLAEETVNFESSLENFGHITYG